jgi:hypothetical protein
MTHLPELDELDVSGAVREAADRVGDNTRAGLLKKAGVGLGALAAGGAFGGILPSIARGAAIPASDIDILNFALTLEYLEAEFYAKAVAAKALTGETKRFAGVVAQHEASHVQFLQKALGAKAVKKPTFDFKGTTDDQAKFQATADVLENTGVHAYLGQLGNIKAKAVLGPAGQIALVEARHAAWIRSIRFGGGTNVATTPAPAGFESGFSKAKILAAVKGTGFLVT